MTNENNKSTDQKHHHPADDPSAQTADAESKVFDDERYDYDRQAAEGIRFREPSYSENVFQTPQERGSVPEDYDSLEDSIADKVTVHLAENAEVEESSITVTVNGSTVFLDGIVASEQERTQAEDTARQVAGVEVVESVIKVVS